MDKEQPDGQRDHVITINLRITPLSMLLIGLIVLAAVLIFAAIASSMQVDAAASADPSATAMPAAGYPAPAAAPPLAPNNSGEAAYPAAPEATPDVEPPAPSLPASAESAPDAPVGVELPPPVFNPTRVAALPPPPVEPAISVPTAAAPAAPSSEPPDLVIDLDTPAPAVTVPPAPPPVTSEPSALAIAAAPPSSGDPPPTSAPTAPPTVPPPAAPPAAGLAGNVRWTTAQSPVRLAVNQQIAPGATLIIDPGVEVQLGQGVSLIVSGNLIALGTPQQPVRFVPAAAGQRWGEIIGTPGSAITLSGAELRGGGAGGTLLSSEGGRLTLRDSQLRGNFGQVRATDSAVEVSGVELSENVMPYGAALQLAYSFDNSASVVNSRISGNRLAAGAAALQVVATGAVNGIRLDIRGNLIGGGDGPGLEVGANAIMAGDIVCNALVGGTIGLTLYSDAPASFNPGLNIAANAIEGQTPPIIPIYLEYGIGRGATSALPVRMADNWWNSPLGPYDPDFNAAGRGEAVGPNIAYAPWMAERPPCAPPAPAPLS